MLGNIGRTISVDTQGIVIGNLLGLMGFYGMVKSRITGEHVIDLNDYSPNTNVEIQSGVFYDTYQVGDGSPTITFVPLRVVRHCDNHAKSKIV